MFSVLLNSARFVSSQQKSVFIKSVHYVEFDDAVEFALIGSTSYSML